MPYKSEAQRRFMHAQHPEIAKRWDKEYSSGGSYQGKKPPGIAVGERNPSGETKTTPFRRKAIMKRLGANTPGQKSQNPRQKMSPQVAHLVRRQEAKKAVSEARKSNIKEKQYYSMMDKQRRQTALERRSKRK